MIQLLFVNQSEKPWPRKFVNEWIESVVGQLPATERRRLKKSRLQMTLVFLPEKKARRLNKDYRDRDYATDVLSFPGDGVEELGDLVLCPEVLTRQAREHGLSFRSELAYMVLHGLLHLLGYDHEGDEKKARVMFRLQDRIFHRLGHLHRPAKFVSLGSGGKNRVSQYSRARTARRNQ